VGAAFHTVIHYLDVGGVRHFANMSDPQIPAALAPAVIGIVSLHDFRAQPELVLNPNPDYTYPGGCPAGSVTSSCYAVTPPDLAMIYNINPLFSAGISGQGQTIYLIEDTNLFTNKTGRRSARPSASRAIPTRH
jgi:subtilase family serine protease